MLTLNNFIFKIIYIYFILILACISLCMHESFLYCGEQRLLYSWAA